MTDIERVASALRKANYKLRFFGPGNDPTSIFAERLRALCQDQSVPRAAMADLLEAQAELLRDN